MNIKNLNTKLVLFALGFATIMGGCQKMSRPEFGTIVTDPPPPPYSTLKNFFEFEDNPGDSGQFRNKVTAENITYVDGIKGKAAQIGAGGYILQQALNDSIKTPGSFTLAFWMNNAGTVQNGAQGVFAISNSTQFWGNFEVFLENDATVNEAYLKVHMFNKNATDGVGEEWNEIKIPGALAKWTHIAITYDAGTSAFNIYSDGASVYNKTLGGGSYGNLSFGDVTGMVIGTYAFQTNPSLTNHGPEDWARSFNGALDNFRVYNVALSADDVNSLFTNHN